MHSWRAFGIAAAAAVVGLAFLAAMLEFLAPDLAYRIHDRAAELFSGRGGRPFRIALGSQTGPSYRVGTVLNRYLKSKAGYELELGNTDNASSSELLDPAGRVDFAGYQFVTHARRNERVRARRKLLGEELAKLEAIRREIESAPNAAAAKRAAGEADGLLSIAERDAAADLLDAAGIESLRSLHRLCWRAADGRGGHPATHLLAAAAPVDTPC